MHTHRETESDPTVLVEISRKKLDIKDKNKISNVLKVFYVRGNRLNVLYLFFVMYLLSEIKCLIFQMTKLRLGEVN